MKIESLSALVFRSDDPERLARFYREHLGIPFAPHSHGSTAEHREAWLDGIHCAILRRTSEEHQLAPTFRVPALDECIKELASVGVPPLRSPIQLDEQMRVASFCDVDGNTFNLIEFIARK